MSINNLEITKPSLKTHSGSNSWGAVCLYAVRYAQGKKENPQSIGQSNYQRLSINVWIGIHDNLIGPSVPGTVLPPSPSNHKSKRICKWLVLWFDIPKCRYRQYTTCLSYVCKSQHFFKSTCYIIVIKNDIH